MYNITNGPEKQTEWSLLWWRLTLPLWALFICIGIIALGQCSTILFGLVASSVWYFCNLMVMTYPFIVASQYHADPGPEEHSKRLSVRDEEYESGFGNFQTFESQTFVWKRIGYVSAAISIVEMLLCIQQPYVTVTFRVSGDISGTAVSHSQMQPMAWIIGNTLFGIIGFFTIPLLMRSPNWNVVQLDYQEYQFENMTAQGDMQATDNGDGEFTLPITGAITSSSKQSDYSRMLFISAACCAISWLVMFTMYSSDASTSSRKNTADYRMKQNPTTGYLIWNEWFLLQMLSVVLCIVLGVIQYSKSKTNVQSFDYTVVYSTILVHLPLFLGHLCVKLFLLAELEEEEQILFFKKYAVGSNISTSWVGTVKFVVSMLFLGLMQCYFHIISQVLNCVAKPSDHPSFLYIGQLYYYMFWYILVSTETAIDGLYWAMLLLNNVHIAFLNTGVYTDARDKATEASTSLLSCMVATSTISQTRAFAMCFRPSFHMRTAFVRCRNTSKTSQSDSTDMEDETVLSDRGIHFAESSGGRLRNSIAFSRRSGSEYEMPISLQSSPRNLSDDKHIIIRDAGTIDASQECTKRNITKLDKNRDCATGSLCLFDPKSIKKGCVRCQNDGNVSRSENDMTDTHKSLYFLMKLAEQDNMADTTALILVPTIMTMLSIAATPSDSMAILIRRRYMWMRCICMFVGRLGSAYLAREIFACKLRSRLSNLASKTTAVLGSASSSLGSSDGLSTRLWIQRLMLFDFHRQFGYFTAVTLIVTFACFERSELPIRFAFLT